jgi:hypothetical protein
MPHLVFEFHFTADLHTEQGRNIAAAAQARLRSSEIDNLWKDHIGRGRVGSIETSVDRVTDNREWSVSALSIEGDYDLAAATALREEVLTALQQYAQEFKEIRSELYDPE